MENIGLDNIESIIEMGDRFLELMESKSRLPSREKQPRYFKIGEVEDFIGKSRPTIIAAEEKGIIDPCSKVSKGGHRWYTLKQINQLRKHYNLLPWRDERDEAVVIGSVVSKGGVGKSVDSVTLAHAFARRGYRVGLIDLDPQATSTSAQGYIPDHIEIGPGKGIDVNSTVFPFMTLDPTKRTLDYALRDTNWDGLKLIPSNLETYNLEYLMFSEIGNIKGDQAARRNVFQRLSKGINSIKSQFDIIFVDAPPSFGFIPLSILCACDALLVPSPARMYDFFSTIQFFRMVKEAMVELDPGKTYKFFKVLVTQYDQRMADQQKFLNAMRKTFKDFPLNSVFHQSADVQKAASEFKSIYEFSGTQQKTIDMVEQIVSEVEFLVRSTWQHTPVSAPSTVTV